MLLVIAFDLHALREFVWLTSGLIELSEGDGKCQISVIHYAINLLFVRRFVKHFFLFFVVRCFVFITVCVTRVCCCWLAPGAPRFAGFGHKKIPILMDGDGVLFVGILAEFPMMIALKFQCLDHVSNSNP